MFDRWYDRILLSAVLFMLVPIAILFGVGAWVLIIAVALRLLGLA